MRLVKSMILVLVFLPLATGANGGYRFTRIAHSNDGFSGFSCGGGNAYDFMINDAGAVVFEGERDEGAEGVFLGSGGPRVMIADTSGPFRGGRLEAVNNQGMVAGVADLESGQAIVLHRDGELHALVSTADGFTDFDQVHLNDRGTVTFLGTTEAGTRGLYMFRDGQLSTVVEQSDGEWIYHHAINNSDTIAFATDARVLLVEQGEIHEIANLAGCSDWIEWLALNDAGTLAFLAGGEQRSLFIVRGGQLETVAVTPPVTTVMPGTQRRGHEVDLSRCFDADAAQFGAIRLDFNCSCGGGCGGPDGLALNNQDVLVFGASLADDRSAIFKYHDGQLETVAEAGHGLMNVWGPAISDQGAIVFKGSTEQGTGLYVGPDPIADRIIGPGDPLLGSTLSYLLTWNVSINGTGQIAFQAGLANGTEALVRADPCPDACAPGPDCNGNGVSDVCDVCSGTSQDCNGNDVPDACELAAGTADDCNGNGMPDACEFDCNNNGVPDDCDFTDGTATDCNGNGVPDSCEPDDCNENGIPDSCEITAGLVQDHNDNGIPGDCEPELVTLMEGVAAAFPRAAPDSFISPRAEDVPFDRFTLLATEDLTLDAVPPSTGRRPGGRAPTVELFNEGNGLHAVRLQPALALGTWRKLALDVTGQTTGVRRTLEMWVAHHPGDINQDGIVDVADATAFGVEFRSRRSPALLDLNGGGTVNTGDATTFGDIWSGRGGATRAWRGSELPPKPE